MQLSDVWTKIAQQKKLTPEEEDFLQRTGNETQQRNSFMSGNITPAGVLSVEYPFVPIFSRIFEQDTANVFVQIPGNINHLFIFSSGRATGAVVSAVLKMTINGDTGDNYVHQSISGDGTTPSATYDYVIDYGVAGGLAGASASAGKAESAVLFISNIQSPFYKSAICLLSGLGTDSTYIVSQKMSIWNQTSKIEDILFSSSSGDILEGSIISVYGAV